MKDLSKLISQQLIQEFVESDDFKWYKDTTTKWLVEHCGKHTKAFWIFGSNKEDKIKFNDIVERWNNKHFGINFSELCDYASQLGYTKELDAAWKNYVDNIELKYIGPPNDKYDICLR